MDEDLIRLSQRLYFDERAFFEEYRELGRPDD